MLLNFLEKRCLGVDIGVSSIKIVEIAARGTKKRLENYAEFVFSKSLESSENGPFGFFGEKTPSVLQALIKKAGMKTRKAAFSIPDFSTFFTNFSLPPMNEEEVLQAVEFEARHHIPLPLSEVSFDWRILEKKKTFPGVALKILLAAVPNKVLAAYQRLAGLARVELKAMEAEVFALIRSSLPKEKSSVPVCLIDIGWQSTTISIVDKGSLKKSYSFDISSQGITDALASGLKISRSEAEKIKKARGLDPESKESAKIIASCLDGLIFEAQKICSSFYQSEGRMVSDIILAGGTSSLFGLPEYLSAALKKEVHIANPFSSLSFPAPLKDRLKEIGPSFSIAVGAGLIGLES